MRKMRRELMSLAEHEDTRGEEVRRRCELASETIQGHPEKAI